MTSGTGKRVRRMTKGMPNPKPVPLRAQRRREMARLKTDDDLEQCVGCGSWIPFGTACSHCDEIGCEGSES
jgi:ribosomal protein L32